MSNEWRLMADSGPPFLVVGCNRSAVGYVPPFAAQAITHPVKVLTIRHLVCLVAFMSHPEQSQQQDRPRNDIFIGHTLRSLG
jgi:hypothetical protein